MSDIEPVDQQNSEILGIVNQDEFTIELQNYYSGHNENSKKLQWTNERIQSVIKLLDEYNTIKSQGRRPTNKHYHHARKYDVMNIGNQKVLIMKRKDISDPVVQIIPTGEYYQKILDAHIATRHGRRDKIVHALKDKYVVPIFAVSIFLNLCKTCLSKKSLNTTKMGLRQIRKDAVPTQQLFPTTDASIDGCSSKSKYVSPSINNLSYHSGVHSGSSATSQQDKPLNTLPEAKEIIANVYRYLQAEFLNLTSFNGNSCDLSPLADILKRTADATGVSEQTVITVLGERKRAEDSARVKTAGRKRKKESAKVKTDRKKRSKPILSFDEEDVSPIEEESQSEVSESDDEHADEDTNMEEVEHEIETLKVEIDEEGDWTKGLEPPDFASNRVEVEIRPLETTSAVQHLLSTTQVTVKTEPDDSEYRHSGSSEQSDTRGETLVVVKIEPPEDVGQTLGPSSVPQNKSEHAKNVAAKPPEDSR